ncbi:MAG: hypothetical protein LRZ98_01525 [Candidatus Pacebacteria bacterium]|nr:hypothetical protein [Candidatus Paceibacterota bacterium]
MKSSFDNQNLFKYKNKKTNIFFIFFIFSLIFLVFTASFAFFYLFFLKDDISNQFLTMEIIGPNNVKSGDIFEYKIKINNSTDIKYRNLKLVIRYPDLSVDTVSRLPIKNRIVEIERDLMPNSFIFKNFNLSLFGSRGQERDILIKLYYTPENSSAILSKSKIYRLIMKDSPVLVEVNIPEKTLSKEKFSGNFSIKSTSKQDLNDLLIVVNHSQSFEFIDFDIEPVFSSLRKKAFIIPNLKYEGIKEINFSAKLLGHLEEENFFSVEVGKGEDFVINPNNLFIKKEDKISIIAEDFDFRITATGRKQNVRNIFVGYPNSKIDLNLRLKNNSDYNIHDLEIKTKIEGDFFNKRTVSVDDGFFSSKNNKII